MKVREGSGKSAIPLRLFALSVAFMFSLGISPLLIPKADAQTFTVIHQFSNSDGASPYAGLTVDSAGGLYGTASKGGDLSACLNQGCGVVFRLAREGTGWRFAKLSEFDNAGERPLSRPVFGPDGILYGTTNVGGSGYCGEGPGCGTAYSLRPGAAACPRSLCFWSMAVLVSFGFGSGGAYPGNGDVIFDQVGNMYGTVEGPDGAVWQLTPDGTYNILHAFDFDGSYPEGGIVFDRAGNLYGTTLLGGDSGNGVVYELTPVGNGWTEKVIYSFQGGSDGKAPAGGLIIDAAGNLYGTTSGGGDNGGGTIFVLSPSGSSWNFTLLYSLTGRDGGPASVLTMGPAGSLYGTTVVGDGAFGEGSVFKLTPLNSGWVYTSLHDFTGGSDGAGPYGNVTFDSSGSLYGTAVSGGLHECYGGFPCGVVYQIAP